MLGGCCLIGTGMAYVAKPTPAKTDFSDKSAEYIETYEQAYESEAKKIRQKSAWLGSLTTGCIGTVSAPGREGTSVLETGPGAAFDSRA